MLVLTLIKLFDLFLRLYLFPIIISRCIIQISFEDNLLLSTSRMRLFGTAFYNNILDKHRNLMKLMYQV